MKSHKDLDVWQKSIALITKIYKITGEFPKEEIYGITSQIRRAAVSVASNIAEGAARNHHKEFIQFLSIALGSLAELETQFEVCKNINYLQTHTFEEIDKEIQDIRQMIIGLMRYLRDKSQGK